MCIRDRFSRGGAVSQFEVAEDGHVLVFIKSLLSTSTVVCTNMHNTGNSYKMLIRLLKSKGLIALEQRVKSVAVKANQLWDAVEVSKDTFNSSDVISITLCNSLADLKKAIGKLRGKPQE
eukprot:TRINITY_DN7832_c0_g1_i2.p1 TRINITY_DN7832_c0_g1~~TRINITY_DN7832_c0_g1_i2.p1  ORF type:complete len:120 (-),score=39.26 TRINITY_DN7832_c0_g1_i2:91-450(-)